MKIIVGNKITTGKMHKIECGLVSLMDFLFQTLGNKLLDKVNKIL